MRRVTALCVAAILVSGCASDGTAVSFQKKNSVTLPNGPSITHCFGRYLIDAPANFEFSHRYAHRSGLIDITHGMSQITFDLIIQRREAELKAKPLNKAGKSWYLDTLAFGPKQKIIRFYNRGFSKFITDIDGYVFAGKTLYKFDSLTSSSKLESGTKWVSDTLERVRARAPGEIPAEPGFCIDGAFISGNENVGERVNIGMAPSDQPAVRIDFMTSTPNAVDPGLLEREEAVPGFFNDFKKIRRSKRTINGIEGEESLLRTTNKQGKIIHIFTFNSYHGKADNRQPSVDIEMAAGGPTNGMASPYTDEEAVQLWDRITSTIRLRPGAF